MGRRVASAEGAVLALELVGELRTEPNLDALCDVEHDGAELPVECVAAPHLVQGRALAECAVGLLVGMEVAAEAVVSHALELADELFSVCHEAARDEQVRLLVIGEEWLPVLYLGS